MINEKRDAIWMAQISKCHANSISNNIHDQRDFGNTEFTTYGLHPLDPQRLVDGNLATPFFFFQNTSFENLKSKLLQVFTYFFLFCFCLQTLFADRLGTDNSALCLFYKNVVPCTSHFLETRIKKVMQRPDQDI